MQEWLLRTENEYFLVTEETVLPFSGSGEAKPCLLSPSLNFRNFLTIPADTNRDREDIKLDLFKKSLPQSIDELQYQFIDLGTNNGGEQTVLTLGIQNDKFREIRHDDVAKSTIYFFEALIATRSEDPSTLLRIHFPEGQFFSFHQDSMVWSRFKRPLADEEGDMTEDYVQETFGSNYRELTIEEFSDDPESRRHWAEGIREFLPEEFVPDRALTSRQRESAYDKLRTLLIVFLVTTTLASLSWIYYESRRRSELDNWINVQYVSATDEESSTPLTALKERVEELESSQVSSTAMYPRLTVLDRRMADYSIRVLRMNFQGDKTDLVMLVESLEDIESLRDNLLKSNRVKSVNIPSTDSMSYNRYNYEVKLTVGWV